MIDYEATMKSIGNDHSLFESLAEIFLEDYPVLLDELGQAVMSESHEAVYSAAHRLKGLISNFHAKEVMDILAEIEDSARLARSTSSSVVVQHVTTLCANIAHELNSHLEGS